MAQENYEKNDEIVMYGVKDVQRILHLGKNNVYKLIQLPNFPVIQIGKKYIIPKKEFEQWISNSLNKSLL